eukprot:CAMPEP_0202890880 /NCGR_PEP_ID=MMETSP1392-20130828/1147_1 /ASSEMBLY_ACC=CAM_ASM_000868 /TAXON_ID=225041 /ORGANISM="Chlamydomonas chlamydogama, Strain SAG 11-48b" /LENGTH=34 /DNA_ID= /DNA_START= /DNA_END= /DNA_ORIENTATION=
MPGALCKDSKIPGFKGSCLVFVSAHERPDGHMGA